MSGMQTFILLIRGETDAKVSGVIFMQMQNANGEGEM